jgi:hypothetical protein
MEIHGEGVDPSANKEAGQPSELESLPNELLVRILAHPQAKLKALELMAFCATSRRLKSFAESAEYFHLVWAKADFCPREGEEPINRGAFLATVHFLAAKAESLRPQTPQTASGASHSSSALSLPTPRSEFRKAFERLSGMGVDPGRVGAPPLLGRFDVNPDIYDVSKDLMMSPVAMPADVRDKPVMVLDISGLQGVLTFDDLFRATGLLSRYWALHLFANGFDRYGSDSNSWPLLTKVRVYICEMGHVNCFRVFKARWAAVPILGTLFALICRSLTSGLA